VNNDSWCCAALMRHRKKNETEKNWVKPWIKRMAYAIALKRLALMTLDQVTIKNSRATNQTTGCKWFLQVAAGCAMNRGRPGLIFR